MIQPLNYSRSLRKQCLQALSRKVAPELNSELLRWIESSVKIQLPDGGRLIGDKASDVLNDMPLNLPFDSVCIEYRRESTKFDQMRADAGEELHHCLKCIVLAKHWQKEDESECNWILLREVSWFDYAGVWAPLCEVLLPKQGYAQEVDGQLRMMSVTNPGIGPRLESDSIWKDADLSDGMGAVIDLIAALACSNIKLERKKARKVGRKVKSALPFDSYHYLTVDVPGKPSGQGAGIGDRRSPREHIRRGHIRRLADGRAIWINAAIINAGIGSKVDKAYVMRRGA